MKKIIIISVFIISICLSFFAGNYFCDKENMELNDQRYHTMIAFSTDRLNDIKNQYDADIMETLISHVCVAYEYSNDSELSSALHDLWNALIFDGGNIVGKENDLINALTAGNSQEINNIAHSMRTPKESNSISNSEQNADTSNPNEGKNWSEQDVASMFSHIQEADWVYIDCVLIPDHASDRIGAVLFYNDKKQTSNVAFFDADGHFQQCGIFAKMSAEPGFKYLGDGAVTFKLETEDGTVYNCTLTISIDDSQVNFKVEDDFEK